MCVLSQVCVCVCDAFMVADAFHLSRPFPVKRQLPVKKALWTDSLHHQPQLLLTQAHRNLLLHSVHALFKRTREPTLFVQQKKCPARPQVLMNTKHLFCQCRRFDRKMWPPRRPNGVGLQQRRTDLRNLNC